MLAESIIASGKSYAPAVQARLPDGNENAQEGGTNVKAEKPPDLAQTAEIVAEVQKNLDMIQNTDLQFSVHEASGEVMVTVRDEASGEVVREIPPRETLNLAAKLDEMIGLIFDQKG